MKKFLIVFGTRPEAVKMCPLVKELSSRAEIKTVLCVTGQHRALLDDVLEIFGVRPQYDLDIMKNAQTLAEVTSATITGVDCVIEREKPDAVLVHGDTASAFSAALAAFYRGVPVAHVEAGLRTPDVRSPFPEEFNRRTIDLIASICFAPTVEARNNLIREGKSEKSVYITGNTVVDALRFTVAPDFCHPLLDWAKGARLVLLTSHRRESIGAPMLACFGEIRRLVEENEDIKIIYPVHPNPKVSATAHEILGDHPRIRLTEPLDVVTFHNILARAHVILTDSGGIQEESACLGKPALVLRDVTERPEGVAAGILHLVGGDGSLLLPKYRALFKGNTLANIEQNGHDVYGNGNASRSIANILINKFCQD